MPKKFNKSLLPGLILLTISLISFLGLDYLQLKRDKSESIIFAPLKRGKERDLASLWFEKEIIPLIQGQFGTFLKILEIIDKPICQVRMQVPEKSYEKIAPELKEKFIQSGYKIEIKAIEESETKKILNWALEGKKLKQATLLFDVDKTMLIQAPVEPIKEPALKKPLSEKRVVIIIDDLGNDLETIKALIDLSRPLTVSILPFTKYARETAEMAAKNKLEVMLHLPLESINSQENDGPSIVEINSKMNQEEIISTLRECLEALPFVQGVNNHRGSLITQDSEIMKIILAEIKSKGLYFIDSRTTDKSIAYKLANQMSLLCDRRDIFLDAEKDRASIEKQVRQLIQLCRERGKAIAIGHPFPETISYLPEAIKQIEMAGIKIVPASEINKPR